MNEMNDRNNNQKGGEHKGMLKHGLMMMICCLAPILLIALVPVLGIKGGAILPILVALACPLGMGFMMFSMMKSNKKGNSCHGNTDKSLPSENDN